MDDDDGGINEEDQNIDCNRPPVESTLSELRKKTQEFKDKKLQSDMSEGTASLVEVRNVFGAKAAKEYSDYLKAKAASQNTSSQESRSTSASSDMSEGTASLVAVRNAFGDKAAKEYSDYLKVKAASQNTSSQESQSNMLKGVGTETNLMDVLAEGDRQEYFEFLALKELNMTKKEERRSMFAERRSGKRRSSRSRSSSYERHKLYPRLSSVTSSCYSQIDPHRNDRRDSSRGHDSRDDDRRDSNRGGYEDFTLQNAKALAYLNYSKSMSSFR